MKPEANKPQDSGPSRNGPTIPIVGIGASAGGIGALETLIPIFERGAGLAYVVVQHLDPERKSGLTGLLARTAKIPVTEIADQVTIEADHVYVIPPTLRWLSPTSACRSARRSSNASSAHRSTASSSRSPRPTANARPASSC